MPPLSTLRVRMPAPRLESHRVSVANREIEFACLPHESIVEAADDHGVSIDTGCRSGVCATCKARVICGMVEHEQPDALTPKELESGIILTCCARPQSDLVIELLDESY